MVCSRDQQISAISIVASAGAMHVSLTVAPGTTENFSHDQYITEQAARILQYCSDNSLANLSLFLPQEYLLTLFLYLSSHARTFSALSSQCSSQHVDTYVATTSHSALMPTKMASEMEMLNSFEKRTAEFFAGLFASYQEPKMMSKFVVGRV
jgi:hypothetical protein